MDRGDQPLKQSLKRNSKVHFFHIENPKNRSDQRIKYEVHNAIIYLRIPEKLIELQSLVSEDLEMGDAQPPI